jgi:predicted permease
MEILTTTLGQMTVLFLLILIGYLLAKLKAVPENTSTVLSKLENNLLVPALVLGTFISNFTTEKLGSAWKLFLFSFVTGIIMILLAILVGKCCSKDQYIRNIYTYGLAFSNFGFMGNAVVSVVFPEMFVDYLIFTMALWMMVYMWGVPCLLIPSEGEKQTIKSRLKSFANPMFAALIIGAIIGLGGITLPTPIMTVITTAGNCMSPIAMLLTGITVANMDVKKVLSMKSIYVVSLVRLIVFPLIFIGVFKFMPMTQTIMVCTICSLAMPLGLSTIVVPGGYGRDTSVAAGMAIVSHLLSAITIPIIFYIMMNVL